MRHRYFSTTCLKYICLLSGRIPQYQNQQSNSAVVVKRDPWFVNLRLCNALNASIAYICWFLSIRSVIHSRLWHSNSCYRCHPPPIHAGSKFSLLVITEGGVKFRKLTRLSVFTKPSSQQGSEPQDMPNFCLLVALIIMTDTDLGWIYVFNMFPSLKKKLLTVSNNIKVRLCLVSSLDEQKINLNIYVLFL